MKKITNKEFQRSLGKGLWWDQTKDSKTGSYYDDLKNLPNVLECFCYAHPLPKQPALPYYEGDKLIKTLLAGVPRSGNTVVWQVLNSLTDGSVVRTHGFSDSCPLLYDFSEVIITIRHPYDVAYSLKRLGWYSKETNKEIWDDLKRFVLLSQFQTLGYRPDLKITYLKYEEVWNKPEQRIRYLSDFLNKDLTNQEFKNILYDTSIEKNIKRSKAQRILSLKAGKKIQDKNKINPNHIGPSKGSPGAGQELSQDTKLEVFETCGWAFDTFSYEKN